jgi:general secretion pathway protein G
MIRAITAAALVGLVVLAGCSSTSAKMVEEAQENTKTMYNAIAAFCINMDRYPSQEEGPDALLIRPQDAESWKGPYIQGWKTIPEDPWGNAYLYVLTTDSDGEDRPQIISLGADGEPGGTGAGADIVNGQIVGE